MTPEASSDLALEPTGLPAPAPLPMHPLSLSLSPRADARLRHLFRASLNSGRIHPLYLPVLRYRNAQAGRHADEQAAEQADGQAREQAAE